MVVGVSGGKNLNMIIPLFKNYSKLKVVSQVIKSTLWMKYVFVLSYKKNFCGEVEKGYSQLKKDHSQGTVIHIEKTLINDRLRVLKVYWKFHIASVFNIAVIHPWNLLFS